jgi:hypothetical protein
MIVTNTLFTSKKWLIFLLVISFSPTADSFTERRTSVGLKLFRSMLVANTAYQQKITDLDTLRVKIIFNHGLAKAQTLKQSLIADSAKLHGKAVVFELISIKDYLQSNDKILGLFIAEKIDHASLQALIDKSITTQTLLFSPFKGDVEKGVLGGISVESKVRPFINMKTLNASKVTIKSFYLRVSKKHGS